jgi:hypothetical protein
MQSTVILQLTSGQSSAFGCCSRADADDAGDSHASGPSALSPKDASSTALLYPPPRALSQAHSPSPVARRSTPIVLSLKRMKLLRPRSALQEVRPRSGDPREEREEDTLLATPGKDASAGGGGVDKDPSEFDLRQFKAVRLLAPPAAGSGKLHELSIEFWPTHAYRVKVTSASEAQVWRDILASYGEYKEYGSTPSQRNDASVDPNSDLPPYFAYSIPSLYAISMASLLTQIRATDGCSKEGLFRTGKSSPLLLRRMLLNQGEIDPAWIPASAVESPRENKSPDSHVLAFCAKSLLRSLPETILTNALLPKMLDATKWNDAPLFVALMKHLPPTNRHLLRLLFEILYLTIQQPTSRMTVESMTKVVGPNLLPADDVTWIRAMTGASAGSPAAGGSGGGGMENPSSMRRQSSTLNADNPAPGSVNMQALFQCVFDHGAEIWPESEVFAGEVAKEVGHFRYASTSSSAIGQQSQEKQQQKPKNGTIVVQEKPAQTTPEKPMAAADIDDDDDTVAEPVAIILDDEIEMQPPGGSSDWKQQEPTTTAATAAVPSTAATVAASAAPSSSSSSASVAPAPSTPLRNGGGPSLDLSSSAHSRINSLASSPRNTTAVRFAISQSPNLPPQHVFIAGSGKQIVVGEKTATTAGAAPNANGATPARMHRSVNSVGSRSSRSLDGVKTSPRQRGLEYFEREIEREIVIHEFPRFHREDGTVEEM